MKLDDYLRKHGLTSAQFAKDAGFVGKQTVHNYRHGLRFPTSENLRRIREATNGAVTSEDFVDQHEGKSPPFSPSPKRPKRSTPLPPVSPVVA